MQVALLLHIVALASVRAFLPQPRLRYSYQRHEHTDRPYHPTTLLLAFKQNFLRNLPLLAFGSAIAGVTFQVVVLYPWHEELSYEFKELEASIIRLDRALEAVDPNGEQMKYQRPPDYRRSRPIDKYIRPGGETPAEKVTGLLPGIPQEELDVMEKAIEEDKAIEGDKGGSRR